MSSPIRLLALGMVIAVLATPTVRAQGQAKSAAEEQTGLKVGEQAPRFVLKDQSGKERSRDDLLKKGKVALVFFRSADW